MAEEGIQVSLESEQPINIIIVEETPIQVSLVGEIGMKGDPLSVPPEGCFKVTNIYVNANGKLVVSYNDNPA